MYPRKVYGNFLAAQIPLQKQLVLMIELLLFYFLFSLIILNEILQVNLRI